MKKFKNIFLNLRLNIKIRILFAGIVVPFLIAFVMLFAVMVRYNHRYNEITQIATMASEFSIDFKSDFDYKMYRIIIGSDTFVTQNVYEDIRAAQTIAEQFKVTTRSNGNKERAEAILKFLLNLEKHVKKVENNLSESGHYDENITILENDIHTITSLIQDNILEYIYYETIEMDVVRSDMKNHVMNTLKFSIAMFIIMVFLGTVFSIRISNSISKPIRLLSGITEQVAKGDLTIQSNIQNGAEVKLLSDSLNIMIRKLKDLIDTVKIEQTNLRKTELKLLQVQINPHFLYNTLDTIVWLEESGKHEDVVEMVCYLSNYLRSSLIKGDDIVPLHEELIHVRSYLQVQQFRYKDILEYEINIPKELNFCNIPKITLQPLVENALYHGIKNKRGKGKIILNGVCQNDTVILSVEDNGVGMDKDRLDQVVEGFMRKDNEIRKEFYGLYNVNERIRLYFGADYGLSIRSVCQKSTEVRICIPI